MIALSAPAAPARLRSAVHKVRFQIVLAGALLFAFALPMLSLTRSFGSDEASSVWFSRLPLRDLFLRLCDPHPPVYYFLLSVWRRGGETEFWLRFPGLVASLLSIALLARLVRQQMGLRQALWAAWLLAAFPLQSWYAGEARMYALVQLLALVSFASGWRLLQRLRTESTRPPAPALTAVFGLTTLAALSVDYAAWPVWWLLQLAWLAHGRPQPPAWLRAQAVALAPFLLWWAITPQAAALARSYHSIFLAVQAQRLGLHWSPAFTSRLLLAGLIGAAAVSALLGWWAGRRSQRRVWAQEHGPLLLWLALLALCLTPGLLTVKRQLVVLLPPLALARRWSAPGPPLLALGLALSLLAVARFPHGEPWRDVAQAVRQAAPAVIWVDELAAPAFSYYARPERPDGAAPTWVPLFGRDLPALPAVEPAPGAALWIITAESRYRQLTALLPPAFAQRYQAQETRLQPGVGQFVYRRRLTPLATPPPQPAPTLTQEWGLQLPSPLAACD